MVQGLKGVYVAPLISQYTRHSKHSIQVTARSPVRADLLLQEWLAGAERGITEVVYCGHDGAAARLHSTTQVLVLHSTSAEHVSACGSRVLGGGDTVLVIVYNK